MLTPLQTQRWEAYLFAESRAPREEKLRCLSVFLEALAHSPGDDWYPWARSLAQRVVDYGDDFVIRRPLFEQAVFPALRDGYLQGLPGCARWLAALLESPHYHGCTAAVLDQLPEDAPTPMGLWRAALRHDETDGKSRQRLLDLLADQLQYALHELPSGVLFGWRGASPDECLELEKELDEFCGLIQGDPPPAYSALIERCRLHFWSYRNYVLNRDKYRDYADYLSREPGDD